MEPQLAAAPISAIAPGKVNLSFKVGSLRPDGTRGVATLYQAVSVYDRVDAYPAREFSLVHDGKSGFSRVPATHQNLAMRAAKLLAQHAGVKAGVRLEVLKQIPPGAGMSGGSADAAAALVACNELWGLHETKETLKKIAEELGPDVAFALDGGTAVGTGHSDEFSQALSTGSYHWVIIPVGPRLAEDTVLKVLDEHRSKNKQIIGEAKQKPLVSLDTLLAVRSGNAARLAEAMTNDVQAASFKLEPALAKVCEFGEREGALVGIMLAMGPALAFLAASEGEARELNNRMTERGHAGIVASGPVAGARLTDSRGIITTRNTF